MTDNDDFSIIFFGPITSPKVMVPTLKNLQINFLLLFKIKAKLTNKFNFSDRIYICGGYSAIVDIKACYMLDLTQETYEWVESAPMIHGRYKFQMVVAGSKIYAVGGEGAFSAHDNIEVQFCTRYITPLPLKVFWWHLLSTF